MKKTISYYDDDAVYCEYEYEYPNTKEILEIFPEAAKIIPQKIKEWEEKKADIIKTETAPYFEKCNKIKDKDKRDFCKQLYGHMADDFNHIIEQLSRLKKLEGLVRYPKGNFDEKLQTAKEIPIEALFNLEKARRYGRRVTAKCPLHAERTPSFHIYENNSWYCFSCNRGGDNIALVMACHNLGFRDAIKYMAGGAR